MSSPVNPASPGKIVAACAGRAAMTTVEVSSGGLSLRSRSVLQMNEPVKVGLELPGLPYLNQSRLCLLGTRGRQSLGLRFHTADERRLKVHGWIDEYLETM